MATRKGIEVSIAIAEAARQADVDVVSAYPITPQTHIVERLAKMVADGDLEASFITVESEHTAMSASIGASLAGARVFTSTSSQGLALMNEIVYLAPSLRTPIVMALANRSLSGPISIWNDHSDVMSVRDTGWISIFANNGQEAYDLTLMAFKIGEDKRVLLPVMISFDGFILTHMIEPIYIFDDEEVKDFIPPFDPPYKADPARPASFGPVGVPDIYTEAKKQQDVAIRESRVVINEVFKEFEERYGRTYKAVETYAADDAEVLLLSQGSVYETTQIAVDKLRKEGKKVGAVELRLWRPFPFEDLQAALSNAKAVVVLDRAISFGGQAGPVLSEVRSAMYPLKNKPGIIGVVGGLGGRDIMIDDYIKMFDYGYEYLETGKEPEIVTIVGLRE